MGRVDGRVAIITGSTYGIGEAIARVLAKEGALSIITGRSREEGRQVVEAINSAGGRSEYYPLDVTDEKRIEEVSKAVYEKYGRIDILVNNAGTLAPMGLLGMHGAREIAQGVMLNLSAPLMLSDAFCRATCDLSDRRILHVSSGAARTPYPGWSVYCATKAALDHHARAVAEEVHPGLRIASVAPGVLDTAMQAESRASSVQRFPQRARFDELHRQGGLIAPADAATRLVDYLLAEHFGSATTTDLRNLPAS